MHVSHELDGKAPSVAARTEEATQKNIGLGIDTNLNIARSSTCSERWGSEAPAGVFHLDAPGLSPFITDNLRIARREQRQRFLAAQLESQAERSLAGEHLRLLQWRLSEDGKAAEQEWRKSRAEE